MEKKNFSIDSRLMASLIAVILVSAPVVWMILSAVIHQRDLKEFVYELSVATVDSTENNTLKAEQDGDVIRVDYHNAFTVFAQFTKKRAKAQSRPPEGDPELVLTYGNGAVLECWEVRLEEFAARKHGVFWRFTSPEGKVWMYDSDAFSLQLLKNATVLSRNEPW